MGATQRLAELGLTLPELAAPVNAFQPFVRHGDLIYTSGQIAIRDGQLVATGRVSGDHDLDKGQEAARACALNVLAQLQAAAGDLDNIERVIKLTVFVASEPEFTQQPQVADAASELLKEIFGDAGQHARAAVGVNTLPRDASVEIEVIFEARV